MLPLPFGFYKTEAGAQLEIRSRRPFQRGAQQKGRIALEPPSCVPKESAVPTSAKQRRKEQAKV